MLLLTGSGATAGKEFLRLRGVDCGPPRLPGLPMTVDAVKSLESDLRDIGFFDWV